MISSDYPCQFCGCPAWSHYKSIANGRDICLRCYGEQILPSDKRDARHDPVHEFKADNLRYLEQQVKETV